MSSNASDPQGRHCSTARPAARIVTAALLGGLVANAGCGEKRVPCPAGTAEDPARRDAILRDMSLDSEASELLETARALTMCFAGGTRSAVTPDKVVTLGDGLTGFAAAARVTHFADHIARPAMLPDMARHEPEKCREHAAKAEVRAWALELRVRARHDAPLAGAEALLGDGFLELPPGAQSARVLAWLQGGDGAPELHAHDDTLCDGRRKPLVP